MWQGCKGVGWRADHASSSGAAQLARTAMCIAYLPCGRTPGWLDSALHLARMAAQSPALRAPIDAHVQLRSKPRQA
ncbi:hypothetical protein XcvCFBP7113P_20380 [Xanthomonas citri pv. vignicola]|nr:hypothetical protein XcvCFBP7113P_20380 [Xanthomonas citri pv. vignicola]